MTPVELLKSLSGPAALSGAPFGADLIAFCAALQKRGGAGVYVARDDKTAATARRGAQFAEPRLEQVDLRALALNKRHFPSRGQSCFTSPFSFFSNSAGDKASSSTDSAAGVPDAFRTTTRLTTGFITGLRGS